MEIATIVLLFFTLLLAPIPIKARVKIFLSDKFGEVEVRLWNIKFFKAKAEISGAKIKLSGKLNIEIDLIETDFKPGIDFSKCLVVRSVYVASNCNFLEANTVMALNVTNIASSVVVPILCRFTHARVGATSQFTSEKSNVAVEIQLTTSLLESVYSLIKQGVELWNTK